MNFASQAQRIEDAANDFNAKDVAIAVGAVAAGAVVVAASAAINVAIGSWVLDLF